MIILTSSKLLDTSFTSHCIEGMQQSKLTYNRQFKLFSGGSTELLTVTDYNHSLLDSCTILSTHNVKLGYPNEHYHHKYLIKTQSPSKPQHFSNILGRWIPLLTCILASNCISQHPYLNKTYQIH